MVQVSHLYITTGKTQLWLYGPLLAKCCLCFLICCVGFSKLFFKEQVSLILWLQSPSTVILESKKIKSVAVSIFSSSICHEVMGPDTMTLVSLMLSFKPVFSLFSFTLIKRSLASLCFLPLRWCHLHIWSCLYFSWQSWFQLWVIQPSISYDVLCTTVPRSVLTDASCPSNKHLRGQVR